MSRFRPKTFAGCQESPGRTRFDSRASSSGCRKKTGIFSPWFSRAIRRSKKNKQTLCVCELSSRRELAYNDRLRDSCSSATLNAIQEIPRLRTMHETTSARTKYFPQTSRRRRVTLLETSLRMRRRDATRRGGTYSVTRTNAQVMHHLLRRSILINWNQCMHVRGHRLASVCGIETNELESERAGYATSSGTHAVARCVEGAFYDWSNKYLHRCSLEFFRTG